MPTFVTADDELSPAKVAAWCLGLGGVLVCLACSPIAVALGCLDRHRLSLRRHADCRRHRPAWNGGGHLDMARLLVHVALRGSFGCRRRGDARHSRQGIHALVTFLGIVILFEAAAKLTAAFSVPRDFPWGWILFDGIITAVLGGILLTSPATQAGVYLGVLIGINLVSSGIAFLASGLWLRRSLA